MSQFKHLVVRGDEFSYIKKGNTFPYIDCIAEAGATGVHIWFWKEPYLRVKDEFIAYCHRRNIKVHLGIGVGAYDVCNGEDPTDPRVQQKIKDHVAKVLDTQDIDGIEFQTGEYDKIEYKGDSMRGRSHARQLVDSLNPIVEYTHKLKKSLWIRTELLMSNFDEASVGEVSRNLLTYCAVEWSHHLGPFKGENAFAKGRDLLLKDKRFSWFLKTIYRRGSFLQASQSGQSQSDSWTDEWREWVQMLYDANRDTLTICHVTDEHLDIAKQAIRISLEIAP
jgi:hypothetical protein